MPIRIVREDITRLDTQAIVNTANDKVLVGEGCDIAIYKAAGYEELLQYRRDNIGERKAGEVFITPGFALKAQYIIHAVSPLFRDGLSGEEELLRNCYRRSLELARKYKIKSIAFPLIATGSYGYPKEEGMRIALDEISAFLEHNRMLVVIVVHDSQAAAIRNRLYPDLEEYISDNLQEPMRRASHNMCEAMPFAAARPVMREAVCEDRAWDEDSDEDQFDELHMEKLEERMRHLSDTFSEYLLYLIESKQMKNSDVYNRAIVSKKNFSKIKTNPDYHPTKLTALCLCVGARLNIDETIDLLARAGYALSPCDKTDIIFRYFIENEIYDMIELDIQLEEHGLPCIIE